MEEGLLGDPWRDGRIGNRKGRMQREGRFTKKDKDVALAHNKNVPCVVLVSRRVRRKERNEAPVLYCRECCVAVTLVAMDN